MFHHQRRNGSDGGGKMGSMNTSRRIFRGRSGPQDGNLPPPRKGRKAKKYNPKEDESRLDLGVGVADGNNYQEEQSVAKNLSDKEGVYDSKSEVEEEEASNLTIINNNNTNNSSSRQTKDVKQKGNSAESDGKSTNSALEKELHDLKRRIKHAREAIRQSDSLSDPQTWENNCLNAVRNCVMGWRSIVEYYGPNNDEDDDEAEGHERFGRSIDNDSNENTNKGEEPIVFDPADKKSKTMALDVFQLVQLSMQCGPLAGGKPAYFRRCGVQVVKIAFHFFCTALIPSLYGSLPTSSSALLSSLMVPLVQAEEPTDDDSTTERHDGDDKESEEDDDDAEEEEEEEEAHGITANQKQGSNGACINGNSNGDSYSNIIGEDKEQGEEMTRNEYDPYYLHQQQKQKQLTIVTRALISELRFTQRQAGAIQAWIKDAEKFVRQNRPPSKSALKLQEKKRSKKKQKKKQDAEKKRNELKKK